MRSVLIRIILLYQRYVSVFWPPCCRFHPSCSHYALTALRRHGLLRGALLSLWRILRCQPFCRGGVDPVPSRWGKRQILAQALPTAPAAPVPSSGGGRRILAQALPTAPAAPVPSRGGAPDLGPGPAGRVGSSGSLPGGER